MIISIKNITIKRSQINQAIKDATSCFLNNGWALPPYPKWDVTDFGLGDFTKNGLVLINLAEEDEYCEKLMYAKKNMTTPAHCHTKKKEDIIVRTGKLVVQLWKDKPGKNQKEFSVQITGTMKKVSSGEIIELVAGERITLTPRVYHKFYPLSEECTLGEISTANDDLNDNFYVNNKIGRYSDIEEDEPLLVKLIGER